MVAVSSTGIVAADVAQRTRRHQAWVTVDSLNRMWGLGLSSLAPLPRSLGVAAEVKPLAEWQPWGQVRVSLRSRQAARSSCLSPR